MADAAAPERAGTVDGAGRFDRKGTPGRAGRGWAGELRGQKIKAGADRSWGEGDGDIGGGTEKGEGCSSALRFGKVGD